MTRHKLKSINDKGGLKPWIIDMGYSYRLFRLLAIAKTPDATIAHILKVEKHMRTGKNEENTLGRTTVKHWKSRFQEEQEQIKERHEQEVKSLNIDNL